MARAPDERIHKALELYKQGMKLVEIANQLNLPAGTVRRWKSTHKWDSERSGKKCERSGKSKGGQPGNKNAVGNDGGAPEGNKNAERHGFFAKWLPPETMEIMQSIERSDPLNLLWDNIQLQYTAIMRAQKIMYVKDQKDMSKVMTTDGENSTTYAIQQAWDKHANFLQAQSRAMSELRSMVKQYEELCKSDLATEEQKERIRLVKAQADKLAGTDNLEELSRLDQVLVQIKGVV